ncbi:MAG TPA: DUF4149 domain-containing protein [Myxococcales bacterium]|nr:DUF4149 domain-containing protein [Myxococcales bacterium]
MLRFIYRLSTAGMLGAIVFFAAVASQAAFRSGLITDRGVSGNLVGAMLARLDAATLAFSALAVLCAVVLGQPRRALLPLGAGLLAAVSAFVITPMVHAMREAGQTGTPAFGRMHGISAMLMLVEMLLLALALWFEPK